MTRLPLVLLALLAAAPASAYPWMVSHGYVSCASCHVDPMGAGQLTTYGRGMDDLIVRWRVDPAADEAVEDGEPNTGLFFGLIAQPAWLNVSGNVRGGGVLVASPKSTGVYPLVMALDAAVTVDVAPVVAHATLGYGMRGVGPAVVVSPDAGADNALVSREHWLGLKLFDDSLFVRAGRVPLPFGLRNNEHTSFVRDLTRTDTNLDQQHGVAIAYLSDAVRGEVMAIAGNYQVRPDEVRERGYAATVEIVAAERLAAGASSLVTYAARDIDRGAPLLRQAHGVFARYAPSEALVILLEADALLFSYDSLTHIGGAGWLQLDWAVMPGLHVMPALEIVDTDDPATRPPTAGAWAGAAWYPLPQTELRVDAVYRAPFLEKVPRGDVAVVAQLHLYF